MLKNGFIYPASKFLIRLLSALNLVEYFKQTAESLVGVLFKKPLSKKQQIAANNFGIDLFLVAKWGFLALLFLTQSDRQIWKYCVYYLIVSNLFTYFYYHAWGSSFGRRKGLNAQRRRFLNFLFSVAFYVVCYAYLYQFHFDNHIQWPNNEINFMNSLYLSMANSFGLTSAGIEPLSAIVRTVFLTQFVNTFFFLSIIIANSVPNPE